MSNQINLAGAPLLSKSVMHGHRLSMGGQGPDRGDRHRVPIEMANEPTGREKQQHRKLFTPSRLRENHLP
jgi:hypothetical protein